MAEKTTTEHVISIIDLTIEQARMLNDDVHLNQIGADINIDFAVERGEKTVSLTFDQLSYGEFKKVMPIVKDWKLHGIHTEIKSTMTSF